MTTPGTKQILFFDTETNAHGRMSKPVTQTLMQLAWVVTDESGQISSIDNRIVKGADYVGPHSPHDLTPAYVEEHGEDPAEVLAEFEASVNSVVASGGRLVAHNADFDIGVLEHARGAPFSDHVTSATYCTMKDVNVINFCGMRNKRGSFKYPRLSELYKILFHKNPDETLHDALGDTHVLRKSFHELVRLGVVSFHSRDSPVVPRAVHPKVVNRGECNLLVNASDVATLSGLMDVFGRHSYEIAERVLGKYGSVLGASGRGVTAAPTEPETDRDLNAIMDESRSAGSKCDTTSVLGKRERELHAEIDKRGDITPQVAREAKRIVSSRLACSFGVTKEAQVVKDLGIEHNNDKAFYMHCGEVRDLKWGIVGRVDGFSGGRLVEVKTRKARLFRKVRDYERVQLEIYMRMTDVHDCVLIENVTNETGTHMAEHRVQRDDELWSVIVAECDTFFRRLDKLVSDRDAWVQWSSGDTETRKTVWTAVGNSVNESAQ